MRIYYAGREVPGWAGPGQGSMTIPAERWHPYSPASFVTPPFPGYVSGHSTVSAAAARLLALFTGSDRFGAFAERTAGELTEPGVPTALKQARDGLPAQDLTESHHIVLELPTFTATAEMAGISRVLGGYHVQVDNVEGLALGRKVADYVWPKLQAYFDGTARLER